MTKTRELALSTAMRLREFNKFQPSYSASSFPQQMYSPPSLTPEQVIADAAKFEAYIDGTNSKKRK